MTTIEKVYPNYTRLKNGGINTLNNLAFSTGLIISGSGLAKEFIDFPKPKFSIDPGLRLSYKTVSTTLELVNYMIWPLETFDGFIETVKPEYTSEVTIRARVSRIDLTPPKIFID
jgi:hypothetical protein